MKTNSKNRESRINVVHTLLFDELPAKDQKQMQRGWMKMLPWLLRACDTRITSYANTERKDCSGSVGKLLMNMDETIEMLKEARVELIKRHKLTGFPESAVRKK